MTDDAIQIYLSAALDQEACKKTLTEALESRVVALQKRDITDNTIITCLKALCDDPFQINDDVIYDVIEELITAPHDDLSLSQPLPQIRAKQTTQHTSSACLDVPD